MVHKSRTITKHEQLGYYEKVFNKENLLKLRKEELYNIIISMNANYSKLQQMYRECIMEIAYLNRRNKKSDD